MTYNIRRVVTGHNEKGQAVVKIDEISKNVKTQRFGSEACVIWSTAGFPVDNDSDVDPSANPIGTTIEGGTVFRVVRYLPGVAPRNHRTSSIDYAVVMSGAIEMELDGGEVVKLKAGDVLVQRGTIHNWVNRGTEPCMMAFVLVSANPAKAGGKVLQDHG